MLMSVEFQLSFKLETLDRCGCQWKCTSNIEEIQFMIVQKNEFNIPVNQCTDRRTNPKNYWLEW